MKLIQLVLTNCNNSIIVFIHCYLTKGYLLIVDCGISDHYTVLWFANVLSVWYSLTVAACALSPAVYGTMPLSIIPDRTPETVYLCYSAYTTLIIKIIQVIHYNFINFHHRELII